MRDESDQKELVLGNKQLLSIFFIVIAMLGVAFTLGYMIGRNTANVSAAGVSPGSSIPVAPIPNPTPRETASTPSSAAPDAEPATPAPSPIVEKAEKPVPQKVVGTSPAKPYDSETAHAADAKAQAPAAAPSANGPSYLQVAAMKRPEADHMVSVLRDRGFPAVVHESSKEGLFRVLVGPYSDMPTLVDAKAKLKTAGFDNPLIAH